ncbi:hypothetical protein AURDEDRAFT_116232, partial [Auricularia subglabra TFB-10046 SS5]
MTLDLALEQFRLPRARAGAWLAYARTRISYFRRPSKRSLDLRAHEPQDASGIDCRVRVG